MAFCEDCGAPLSPGVLFCENCGAKLQVQTKEEDSPAETGIIYTNISLLENQTGIANSEINDIINGFISDALARNVGYELFDAGKNGLDQDVKNHVKQVQKLVEEKHPDYLFILGSNSVIPSIVWENEAEDINSDKDVSSDLCYSTLDVQSPFLNQKYNFDECLKVGRLPNIKFRTYFENLKKGCGNAGEVKTFGESAEVWTELSKSVYSEIKNGPSLYNCPNLIDSELKTTIPEDTNLLYFNLHGSRQTADWYGQRGPEYFPEAVRPNSFCNIKVPYFLAVEACYGAKAEESSVEKSILLSSLEGKCISFLGSSRIAFGTPSPKGSCADIICDYHLRNLKKGLSAGEALNKARIELCNSSTRPSTRKTLAEFALYGDPSARMNGKPEKPKELFASLKKGSFPRGIRIPLPDVRRAVRMEINNVDAKIADSIKSMIYSTYKDMQGVIPKFYKYSDSAFDDISAVFSVNNQIGVKIVSVEFSPNGQIRQVMESK